MAIITYICIGPCSSSRRTRSSEPKPNITPERIRCIAQYSSEAKPAPRMCGCTVIEY